MPSEPASQNPVTESNSQGDGPPIVASTDSSATMMVDCLPADQQEICVGPYRLLSELGKGAMGTVYVAEHTKLKRKVALKLIHESGRSMDSRVSRFEREMEAVGRLDHPNIVRATDAGEIDGTQYLAMELMQGCDFEELMEGVGQLDVGAACEAIRQAAIGIQHISENDLIHRDIKPSNLFLTDSGTVKILDLGIARLRDHDSGETKIGSFVGTPDFVAPEQVESKEIDVRADIYSLGCTLYTLLAGQTPFTDDQYETGVAKLIAHTEAEPRSLKTLVHDIPFPLVKIISRMMAKQPDRRYQTPLEVANALNEFADAHALQKLAGTPIRAGDATVKADRQHPVPSNWWNKHWQKAAFGGGAAALVACALFARQPAGPTASTNARFETLPVASTAPSKFDTIAEDVQKIRADTESLVKSNAVTEQNTLQIADTLAEIRDSFATADRQGGIMNHPTSAGQYYHNARLQQQRGNQQAAIDSYRALFATGAEFVDVHDQFRRVLKSQLGDDGVRNEYRSLPGDQQNCVRQLAQALTHQAQDREEMLARISQQFPDFAPAFFELARCYSEDYLGVQGLADKAQEKRYLQTFVAKASQNFEDHFLDATTAESMLETAKRRLRANRIELDENGEPPVPVKIQLRSNLLIFQIAEPTGEIWYRETGDQEFRSTGHSTSVDRVTGAPVAQTLVSLGSPLSGESIDVKYTDIRGVERGPFVIQFSVEQQAIDSARRKLQLMKQAWAKFNVASRKNYLRMDLLCRNGKALQEVRYSFDREFPTQRFDLPDYATAKLEDVSIPVPANAKFVVIQLTYIDGIKSEIVKIERK